MFRTPKIAHLFSSSFNVPIIDITPFLSSPSTSIQNCKQIAEALHDYGCLIIKDPRVNAHENDRFLDLMERYFSKRANQADKGYNVPDVYPEHSYIFGLTPEYVEKARDHSQVIKGFRQGHRALTPCPPPHDAKWRYMYNFGDIPQ